MMHRRCWSKFVLWWHARSFFEKVRKTTELRVPLRPFFFRNEEIVANVAEEFDFHDVDFLHGNSGNLGPGLVCVGIVVED